MRDALRLTTRRQRHRPRCALERIGEAELFSDLAHRRDDVPAEHLETLDAIFVADRAVEPEREDSGTQHLEHFAQPRNYVIGRARDHLQVALALLVSRVNAVAKYLELLVSLVAAALVQWLA